MSKVIYLPFESLPQRYTEMWNEAFLSAMDIDDVVVWGEQTEPQAIAVGEFLDVYGTIKYKQTQMAAVADLFAAGKVSDGDVFFVPDIFYPGLAAIRYMAELSGVKVKIVSFNHAGRADEDDFVQRLGYWADTQERAWHQMCDVVLVGSRYHGHRVHKAFGYEGLAIDYKGLATVTGAVWSKAWMDKMCEGLDFTKEEYCIFPHRPSAEKRFELFLSVALCNPELQFVITSCGNNRLEGVKLPANVKYLHNLTKKEYFQVFAHAKYYFSCAFQETFGYTIQEAIYFGCEIIAPNYASYPEYVSPSSLMPYEDMTKPYYITKKFREEGESLKRSVMIADNAKRIYEICKHA